MLNKIILSMFILLGIGNTQEIEGRWHPGGFNNTMYEFVDGLRYTYYCPENSCDTDYWDSLDISDALPTINPYTVDDNTLSIDLHFGNTATYTMGFRCDGQVVDFYYDEDDNWEGLHSTMYRLGFDDFNNDCLEPNPNDCLCTEEWDPVCGVDGNTYSNPCYAECMYVVISYEGECLFLNGEIEGRWHLVGFEHAIMYEFVDTEPFADAGFRYSIYVDENGEFDDLDGDNIGGTPHPYSVVGDIITIDTHFGNILSYQMNYRCDGQVVDFVHLQEDIVHSTLFRENFDYFNSECFEINECDGLNEYECWYAEGCEWEDSDNMPGGGSCVEGDMFECNNLNETECEEAEGCEWEDSDNMPGGGLCIETFIYSCNDLGDEEICESVGCTWTESDNLPGGGGCFDGLAGDVNLDDARDVLDIVLIVNFVLGIANPSDSEFQSSDMNFDGELNVLDIVQLVNIILD